MKRESFFSKTFIARLFFTENRFFSKRFTLRLRQREKSNENGKRSRKAKRLEKKTIFSDKKLNSIGLFFRQLNLQQ